MLDRHARSERGAELRRHGRRQRDFGDHDQHLSSAAHHRCGEPQIDLGLPAAGHAVEQCDLERAGGREPVERAQRIRLLRRQLAHLVGRRHRHRGAPLERVAVLAFVAQRHQAARHQAGDDVGAESAIAQRAARKPGGRCRQLLQRSALLAAEARFVGARDGQAVSRRADHTVRLVARGPALRAGRERRGNRIPDAGDVVVRNPAAQIDDRRREKRRPIDGFDDVLDLQIGGDGRGRFHHDAGNRPPAQRNPHARAHRRHLERVGNGIREEIEERNWYGDGDRSHAPSSRIDFTRFMSSQTSRFADGVRSR